MVAVQLKKNARNNIEAIFAVIQLTSNTLSYTNSEKKKLGHLFSGHPLQHFKPILPGEINRK